MKKWMMLDNIFSTDVRKDTIWNLLITYYKEKFLFTAWVSMCVWEIHIAKELIMSPQIHIFKS